MVKRLAVIGLLFVTSLAGAAPVKKKPLPPLNLLTITNYNKLSVADRAAYLKEVTKALATFEKRYNKRYTVAQNGFDFSLFSRAYAADASTCGDRLNNKTIETVQKQIADLQAKVTAGTIPADSTALKNLIQMQAAYNTCIAAAQAAPPAPPPGGGPGGQRGPPPLAGAPPAGTPPAAAGTPAAPAVVAATPAQTPEDKATFTLQAPSTSYTQQGAKIADVNAALNRANNGNPDHFTQDQINAMDTDARGWRVAQSTKKLTPDPDPATIAAQTAQAAAPAAAPSQPAVPASGGRGGRGGRAARQGGANGGAATPPAATPTAAAPAAQADDSAPADDANASYGPGSCEIGGVKLQSRMGATRYVCPTTGRDCKSDTVSSDGFTCGDIYNNFCVSRQPIANLSDRCQKDFADYMTAHPDKLKEFTSSEHYAQVKKDADDLHTAVCKDAKNQQAEACKSLEETIANATAEHGQAPMTQAQAATAQAHQCDHVHNRAAFIAQAAVRRLRFNSYSCDMNAKVDFDDDCKVTGFEVSVDDKWNLHYPLDLKDIEDSKLSNSDIAAKMAVSMRPDIAKTGSCPQRKNGDDEPKHEKGKPCDVKEGARDPIMQKVENTLASIAQAKDLSCRVKAQAILDPNSCKVTNVVLNSYDSDADYTNNSNAQSLSLLAFEVGREPSTFGVPSTLEAIQKPIELNPFDGRDINKLVTDRLAEMKVCQTAYTPNAAPAAAADATKQAK